MATPKAPAEADGSEPVASAAQDLFEFAIDREDVKNHLAVLPPMPPEKRGAVEYELQLLKIICVGWSISYFLETVSWKHRLAEDYWRAIYELSGQLSNAAGPLATAPVDYFRTIQDRLTFYVDTLRESGASREPAAAIGPAFAATCGSGDDPHITMAGTRLFAFTVSQVHAYLEHLTCDASKIRNSDTVH